MAAAALALLMVAGPAMAQTPQADAPALAPIVTPPADLAILPGSTVAPDCGGLYNLQGRAFCVSALLTQVGTLADAYVADIKSRGWLVAGGDANRVVLIRRDADGSCQGLQMQAFYNTAQATTPTSLGYLAFGIVPGNVCAASPGTAGGPPGE